MRKALNTFNIILKVLLLIEKKIKKGVQESDEEKDAEIREKDAEDSGSGSGIVIPSSGSGSNLITGPRKSVKNNAQTCIYNYIS